MHPRLAAVVAAFITLSIPLFSYAIYFGGAVTSPVQKCDGNAGFYVHVTLPGFFDGDVMWGPGSRAYLNGFPSFVSQNTLGSAQPSVCDIQLGKGVKNIYPIQIDAAPGVGTSAGGGGLAAPDEAPVTPGQCAQDKASGFSSGMIEQDIRDQLKGCNITVNKSACPTGVGFGSVGGGCTSVAGFECDAQSSVPDTLCSISKECGGFQVTGGSEAGHNAGSTHTGGTAVDIGQSGNFTDSFSQCVQKFKKIGPSTYCDTSTGTSFLKEVAGQTKATTGPHWHAQTGGC